MFKLALAPFSSNPPLLKEELKPDVTSSLIAQQNLESWNEVFQFLWESTEENPYIYCLSSCLHAMKIERWQNLNSLQKLIVLSSLRSVMNNDIKLKEKIEQHIDLMLFFQEYQNLLKEVQQRCL